MRDLRRSGLVFTMLTLILLLVLPAWFLPQGSLVPSVSAELEPEQRVFGNPSLPDWQNITIMEDVDFVIVDNADGFVFKFRKGTVGTTQILQNGSVIVEEEQWLLEYLFKEPDTWRLRGEPQYVTWENDTSYHAVVKRFYLGEPETTFNITYSFYGGFRPKISFEGIIGQADTYRIQWQISGINKTYVSQNATTHYVKFWNEGEEAIVFDYSDVYEAFGNITTCEVEEWAGNHKLNEIFNVGALEVGEFRLDPNFGYEIEGTGWQSLGNRISGSVFTITEAGIGVSITWYQPSSSSGSFNYYSKCAIYKHSDLSLVAVTEEKTWHNQISPQWVSLNFTTSPSLEAGTAYILVAWSSGTGPNPQISYDAGDTDQGHYDEETYNNFPNTLVPTHEDRKYSIYCTYTFPPTNPINDVCDASAKFYQDEYSWVNITVSDPQGTTNLKTVDIQVNTVGDAETFTLRWTEDIATFSEVSDSSGICVLDTSTSTNSTVDSDTMKVCFYFKFTAGTQGPCDIKATSEDDEANSDVDTYSDKFEYNGAGFDYVENNTSNVDASADKGTHGNFTAQQYGPDSIYDVLTEDSPSGTGTDIEDYVDNNTSDVDSSPDKGTHSNFESQKTKDGYDTLTEEAVTPTSSFGYDTIGGSYLNQLEMDEIIACRYEITHDNVNITSITFYGRIDGIYGSDKVTYAIYNETGGKPHYLKGYTVEGTWSKTANWVTLSVTSGGQNLPSGYYWLCVWSNDELRPYYDGGGATNQTFIDAPGGIYKDGYPTTFSDSPAEGQAWKVSCYANYTYPGTNYMLDLEVQFTGLDYDEINEKLCIYTGNTDAEDIQVDYWTGSEWSNLLTDLTANTWNNVTVSITSATFTIRFKGGTETGDTVQDSWQVDATLVHVWGNPLNYELDLEVQWTDARYDQSNEELCIYAGTTDAEDIKIYVWHELSWHLVLSDLTANSWNNVSISSYLTTSTFTVRFLGGSESGDTNQDSWQIDCALLHTWEAVGEVTITITVEPNNQLGVLFEANVTVYDQGTKTASQLTNESGKTAFTLDTKTFVFTVYDGQSQMIGNVSISVSQDGQEETITADQNYVGINLEWMLIIIGSVLSRSPCDRYGLRLKRGRRRKEEKT